MESFWVLSLAMLLLGNVIDGLATYRSCRHMEKYYGIGPGELELSPLPRWCMEHLGMLVHLILVKLLAATTLLLWGAFRIRTHLLALYGPQIGLATSTILNSILGIVLALAGTGLVIRALMVIPVRLSPDACYRFFVLLLAITITAVLVAPRVFGFA